MNLEGIEAILVENGIIGGDSGSGFDFGCQRQISGLDRTDPKMETLLGKAKAHISTSTECSSCCSEKRCFSPRQYGFEGLRLGDFEPKVRKMSRWSDFLDLSEEIGDCERG